MNIPPNVLHSDCQESIEALMVEDVVEYVREIVNARGLEPDAVGRFTASLIAALFVEEDESIHLRGQNFGECIDAVGKRIQDCMCKCIDGGGK